MAEASKLIQTPPERVFEVLSDGWLYTGWVVGASHIRAVEPSWPAPGSRIHHAVGAWPLMLRDETRVEACEPSKRLVLLARGRPLGEARVELRLEPHPSGTVIRMAETPVVDRASGCTTRPPTLPPGPQRRVPGPPGRSGRATFRAPVGR